MFMLVDTAYSAGKLVSVMDMTSRMWIDNNEALILRSYLN